jgi:hypothetical protein
MNDGVGSVSEARGKIPANCAAAGLLDHYRTRICLSLQSPFDSKSSRIMAGTTGLEPATSAVTGQRSDQTELRPQLFSSTYAKSKKMLSSAAVYSFSRFHFFQGI